MGNQQALLAVGAVIAAFLIGLGTMTEWSLSPSISLPIMIVLGLLAAACFIVAWSMSSADDGAAGECAIPDMPASDNQSLIVISSGENWKKLNALLYGGAVTAWSRTGSIKNLRPIRAAYWFNGSLEFIESDGRLEAVVAGPNGLRVSRWARRSPDKSDADGYDIHFNRAQLRKHWPEMF